MAILFTATFSTKHLRHTFLLVSMLTSCQKRQGQVPVPVKTPAQVVIVQPARRSLQKQLRFVGRASSDNFVPVYAKVGGFLKFVSLKEGDLVRKGQTIAYSQAGEQYKSATLRSPANGYLVNFRKQNGDYIEKNTRVAGIWDPSSLNIIINVSPEEVALLRNNARISVQAANSGLTFQAGLGAISWIVDTKTGTIPVEIKLVCPEGKTSCAGNIFPGELVQVLAEYKYDLGWVLPDEVFSFKKNKVAIISPQNTCQWISVEKIRAGPGYSKIPVGITPESLVITSYSRKPEEGEQVFLGKSADQKAGTSQDVTGNIPHIKTSL